VRGYHVEVRDHGRQLAAGDDTAALGLQPPGQVVPGRAGDRAPPVRALTAQRTEDGPGSLRFGDGR
jgi:hypothetical protein